MIGQLIVRNANEIGLLELVQSLIVRVHKFLTPATPGIALDVLARLANRKRSAGARASLAVNRRRGPVGFMFTRF